MPFNRRQFLKNFIFASTLASLSNLLPYNHVGAGIFGHPSRPQAAKKSKVCIIRHHKSVKSLLGDSGLIEEMLNTGVAKLTDLNDVAKAWQSLFAATDRVAVKVNPAARHTGSTHPVVSYALVNALEKYVGLTPDSITLYDVDANDLRGAGYPLSNESGQMRVCDSPGYSSKIKLGPTIAEISRILTNGSSAIVNMPVLKHHQSAGITVSLKNHYGSIAKKVVRNDDYGYHDNQFRNLVYLNMMGPIRDKSRLIVVDALLPQYHNGPHGDPRFQWSFKGLIMGTDPVAVDTVSKKIINWRRAEAGLSPITAPYLELGRQEGLGTNLLWEIDVYEESL